MYVLPSAAPQISVQGTATSVAAEVQRLQLFATTPGKTAHDGTAILGVTPTNPQTYAAGAVLASGASVEEIHPDFVVLKQAGRLTRLYRVGLEQSADEQLLAATTVGGPGIADRPLETHASSREDFAEVIRPKLLFDGEKLAGFKIIPGRDRSALAILGLEAGDVIRAIDGRPVRADADWRRVADALGSGTSIVLSIERGDSALSLMMNGNQLNQSAASAAASAPVAPPTYQDISLQVSQ
jgi:hypothetical protein